MERYDIAIIGSGPAGVSAAITAKIRNKNIVLFGSRNLSFKIEKAPKILNYPGLPEISGRELCERFSEHLSSLDIQVTEKQVGSVYAMGGYFCLQAGEDIYEAKSVILAMGAAKGKLLEGEEEFLGRGVSCCATCDGPLYRGKRLIVIGFDVSMEEEAGYLSGLAGHLYYVPVYKISEDSPLKKAAECSPAIEILKVVPDEIYGDMKVRGLKDTAGNKYEADGIFVLRESPMPSQLVSGLKVTGNRVEADINMNTNIPGLFACGDLAGEPYQYIKAAGQGNTAALSAVKYLAGK